MNDPTRRFDLRNAQHGPRPLGSVRSRIIFGFGLLTAVFVCVVVAAALLAWDHDRTLVRAQQDEQTVDHLKAARADGTTAYATLQTYIFTGEPSLIDMIEATNRSAAAKLEQARFSIIDDPSHNAAPAEIASLIEGLAVIDATFDEVIALRQSGDVTGATSVFLAGTPKLIQIAATYDRLAFREQEQATALQQSADRTGKLTIIFLVVSGAIGLMIGILGATKVSRSIFRPLRSLEDAALEIVDGDLSARAAVDGPDEFASLGRAFNQMTEALLDASKRRELEEERARAHTELEKVHTELTHTSERLDGVLTSIQDLVFSVDATTFEVLYMNDNAETIFGRPVADFKADPMLWMRMVLPEDRAILVADRQALMVSSLGDSEFRIQHTDGTIRWLRGRTRLIRDENGEPLRLDGTCTDVTERRAAEDGMRESEDRWRSLVQNGSDIICVVDKTGAIEFISPAIERVSGRRPEELIGARVPDRVHPEDAFAVRQFLGQIIATGTLQQLEFRVQTMAGKWCYLDAIGAPLEGSDGQIVINARDVTDRREAAETISHMAYHDALTGLPNRLLFRDRFEVSVARAKRRVDQMIVLSVDLDRFKMINDTLGHAAGDEVLRSAANRLSRILRESDTLARFGGDEFVMLIEDCNSPQQGIDVATRIVEGFRRPFEVEGKSYHVSASVGLAVYPQDGEDAETLLGRADTAMYAAKDAGRDGWRRYDSEMEEDAASWFAVETELRVAVEQGQLQPYYQPQVSIPTGEMIGVEALLRWNHPERGLVPPDVFIPVAERSGLIISVGEFVLRRACSDMAGWDTNGTARPNLSVNVSYRQIQDPGFVDMVRLVVGETGFPAHRLQLEITESTALGDLNLTRRVAEGLAAMGVMVSIDDFGSGSTSLRYLKEFPIHELKIDQTFIRDIVENRSNAAIATSVIALGHELHLTVVAEGVETEEQLTILRDRDCDVFQGYLHSKPMPLDDLKALFAARSRLVV